MGKNRRFGEAPVFLFCARNFLAMGERAGGFGAAESGGEGEHAERQEDRGEEEQDGERMENVAKMDGTEKRSAHGVERVSDGIEASDELQPIGKNGNGEEHSADDAGDAEQEPFGGIAAFEKKQVAGGKNAETGKSEKRNDENEKDGEPVGGMERETEKERAPDDVNGDAKRGGHERIEGGAGEDGGERGLRDEKVFERAGVARFFEAAIEGVECGVEVIEENETDESESEVAAGLRKRLAKLGAFDEARDVIKGGGAEEGLHDFHDERTAIGFGDEEVAEEEEPEFAKEGDHERSSGAGDSCGWPVRRKKASSRVEAEDWRWRAAGVSSAMRRPCWRTATRSARSSISARE